MSAGYCATPLAKKLGLKEGVTELTMAPPGDYRAPLAPIPRNVSFVAKAPNVGLDVVHLFVTSLNELEKQLPVAGKAIRIDGAIWVSWYKKAAKIPTVVTEVEIRKRALATDLVDVKVCAVDGRWPGLRLVVRKASR
ncbi:MAG TPA: hypothetical protein VHE09_03940 [Rhizomicrobium sp.]|nr:hypothetical protein [Rhizomicrobium sp.]